MLQRVLTAVELNNGVYLTRGQTYQYIVRTYPTFVVPATLNPQTSVQHYAPNFF